MSLQILPVTSPTSLPTLTSIHLSAFHLVPINAAIWPHGITPSITSLTQSAHLRSLESDPSARLLSVVDGDEIIAFAKWHIFDTAEAEAKRFDLGPKEWGPDADLSVARPFWEGIVEARTRMEGKAHCFLAVLATHPSHHRRGAGAMLVQWGTEEADARGLSCFLESSPAGEVLYKKHGFRQIGSFDTDIGPIKDGTNMYRHLVMVRDAKGSNTGLKDVSS